MNLLFLDTETTGTGPEDRLCQVAYKYNEVTRNALYKPPLSIKLTATAVTHITNAMVNKMPAFATSAEKSELGRLSSEGYTLIAHNAAYDLGMLAKEGVVFANHICTLKVARHIDANAQMENHTLQYLRYFYGIELEATAHDALGDVIVLEAIFEVLLQKLIELEHLPTREDGVRRMVDISTKPSLIHSLPFGKYKDQLVLDVARKDPSYCEWLLSAKLAKPEGEEDWIYTLRQALKR